MRRGTNTTTFDGDSAFGLSNSHPLTDPVDDNSGSLETFVPIVVDTAGDDNSNNPDLSCPVGTCTLRAALTLSNEDEPFDILFAIPGAGPHKILLEKELPEITNPTTIDGTSQPGYAGSPLVDIDGSNVDRSESGLVISAGDTAIKALAIGGFGKYGILINSNGDNTLSGNYIGTDATGKIATPNEKGGIRVEESADNLIGGQTGPNSRCQTGCNIISGNDGNGIEIVGEASTGNTVRGNNIGTGPKGRRSIPNNGHGVFIDDKAAANTVGGTIEDHFGTNKSNTIGFNASSGVFIASGTGNAVLSNSIFSNGGAGINLANADAEDDGATDNDENDIDEGPNNVQNFPSFVLARVDDAEDLIIQYRVTSDPTDSQTAYPVTVQFFRADDTESGQGRVFLGSDEFTIEHYEGGVREVNLGRGANLGVVKGTPLVSTATDATSNTSEFSKTVLVNETRTFTVNTTSDGTDIDNICDVAHCNLREAITAANSNDGIVDRIEFNLLQEDDNFDSETGVFTIRPTSALPVIEDAVILDGTTQSEYIGSPVIVLDGSEAGSQAIGLHVTAGDTIIRGFVVNRFSGDGIRLDTNGGSTIEGNFIGTDYTGSAVDLDDNPIGNGGVGVRIARSFDNVIGGALPRQRNVIAGNNLSGVTVFGEEATGNIIVNNSIGTDLSATKDLGNTGSGVSLLDSSGNTIKENSIGYNGNGGVRVESTSSNLIETNSIFLNDGIGINLVSTDDDSTGRTENDTGGNADSDDGPNRLQNHPSLTESLIFQSLEVTVEYKVDSQPQSSEVPNPAMSKYPIRVQFFKADADSSALTNNEGRVFLGEDTYSQTDVGSTKALSLGKAVDLNLVVGDMIVATAIDANGNTSEFAPEVTLANADGSNAGGVIVVNDAGDSDDPSLNCDTDPLADGKQCTLRAAIQQAVAGFELFRIEFAIPSEGVATINPLTALPDISRPVIIDGTTQAGYSGTPMVELDGSHANPNQIIDGLRITGSDVRIRGLAINRFHGDGLVIETTSQGLQDDEIAGGNVVENTFIGTNVAGISEAGNFGAGLRIRNSKDNTIRDNVISGNHAQGVVIENSKSAGNVISANNIGTDANGVTAIGNGFSGLRIDNASDNTIGGLLAIDSNVIGANGEHGIFVFDTGSTGNRILGNHIGSDVTGTLPIGNVKVGIFIEGGSNNCLGFMIVQEGTSSCTPSDPISNFDAINSGNTIAFNGGSGLFVKSGTGNSIRFNSVYNNSGLGLEIDGNATQLAPSVSDNTDTLPRLNAYGNLIVTYLVEGAISGQLDIDFYRADSDGEEGMSYLGSDTYPSSVAAGDDQTSNVGNPKSRGVTLNTGDLILATATDEAGNTSQFSTVPLESLGLAGFATFVVNVGIDIDLDGIDDDFDVSVDAKDADTNDGICDIDTETPGHECTIHAAIEQANATAGADRIDFSLRFDSQSITPNQPLPDITDPVIIDATTQPGYVSRQLINLSGKNAGSTDGITITEGDSIVRGLIINRFDGDGIVLEEKVGLLTEGSYNGGSLIESNIIGTNADSDGGIGNIGFGLLIDDSANNLIGGDDSSSRNVISGNDSDGVRVSGNDAINNRIVGNFIGTDVTGTTALENDGDGIEINGSGTIEAPNLIENNVISGNGSNGVYIRDADSIGNSIFANFIGTDATGKKGISNTVFGILVHDASSTVIGGATPNRRNIISANGEHGVAVGGTDAKNNLIEGNFIGTDVTGNDALGNGTTGFGNGVLVADAGAIGSPNTIRENVISSNTGHGVSITGVFSVGNEVVGNLIGTNADGIEALGNIGNGITISVASNNTVGGIATDSRNLISTNQGHGVHVTGNGATDNSIVGNYVGTDVTGSVDLGNSLSGIAIEDVGGAGGANSVDSNLISGNDQSGLTLAQSSASGSQITRNFVGTDATGRLPLGNAQNGIEIVESEGNTIGGARTASPDLTTLSLSPNLSEDGLVFAATQNGLMRSRNRGTSWRPVDLPLADSHVTHIEISPTFGNDGVVFVGTSEEGVIRSMNGGESWMKTNSGLESVESKIVNSIATSPIYSVDRTAFVATDDGLFVSTNGGDSWTRVGEDAGIGKVSLAEVSPAFVDDRTVFAVTSNRLFRSQDGGATWSQVNDDTQFTSVSVLAFSPDFAHDQTIFTATLSGLFRSESGGDIWNQIAQKDALEDIQAIAVSPEFTTDEMLIVGTPSGALLSADRGDNWKTLIDSIANPNVETVALSPHFTNDLRPGADKTLLIGTSVGVYRSGTRGETWSLMNRGLSGMDMGNLISGNGDSGVRVDNSDSNTFASNFIGTNLEGECSVDVLGACDLGNGGHGLFFDNSSSANRVIDNVIAYSKGGDGVFVKSGDSIEISGNSTLRNRDAGIALDAGANDDPIAPVITEARINAHGNLMLSYFSEKGAAQASPFRIEFFVTDADSQEGQTLLHSDTFVAPAANLINAGDASEVGLTLARVGTALVASVTDADGNTSEFSVPVSVSQFQTFVVRSNTDYASILTPTGNCDPALGNADCTLRDAILSAHVVGGTDHITFDIAGDGPHQITPTGSLPEITSALVIDTGEESITLDGTVADDIVLGIETLAVKPFGATSGIVYAGTANGLFRSPSDHASWAAIDDAINNVRIIENAPVATYPESLYIGTADGVLRVDDGPIVNVTTVLAEAGSNVSAIGFSNDFALDSTLYVASESGLFRITDDPAGVPISVQVGFGADTLNEITAMSVSSDFAADRTLYATNAIGLFRIVDDGLGDAVLTQLILDPPIDIGTVNAIDVSPGFAADDTLYIGGTNGLFRVTDNGVDSPVGVLIELPTSLSSNQVVKLILSPDYLVDLTLYAAKASGLFHIVDDGILDGSDVEITTTGQIEDVRDFVLSPFVLTDGTLFAGTFGDGVFVADGVDTRKLGTDGIRILSGNTTIRGLSVTNFSGDGIVLLGNGSGTNEGSYDGGSLLQGNQIGTDANGSADIGNGHAGIAIIESAQNIIGGETEASANVISGNGDQGIVIGPRADENVVIGNHIGNCLSDCQIGNANEGVLVVESSANRIGGTDPREGNVIAYNSTGIRIESGDENAVLSNSVFENGSDIGLGIELVGASNNDQNAPELEVARIIENDGEIERLVVQYSINTAVPLNVEFFVGDDAASDKEGKTLVVRDRYQPGRLATQEFERFELEDDSIASLNKVLEAGNENKDVVFMVATATDDFGNTSQFSGHVAVRKVREFKVNSLDDTPGGLSDPQACDEGEPCTLRDAIIKANDLPGLDSITFDVQGTIDVQAPLPEIVDSIFLGNINEAGVAPDVVLNGSLARTDGLGKVTAMALSPGFASDDDIVFVGTPEGVFVSRYQGDNAEKLTDATNVISISVSPDYAQDGVIYAGNDSGLLKITDDRVDNESDIGNFNERVNAVAVSRDFATDKAILIGTDSGLYRLVDGAVVQVEQIVNAEINAVNAIAVVPLFAPRLPTTHYVGTDTGLFRFTIAEPNGVKIALQGAADPINSKITAIAVSPSFSSDRLLYVSTESELILLRDDGILPIGNKVTRSSADVSGVQTIALSPSYSSEETFFVGTPQGVFVSKNTFQVEDNPLVSGLDSTDVRAIAVSPSFDIDAQLIVATFDATNDHGDGIHRSSNAGDTWQASRIDGIRISDDFSAVRGLVINGFSGNGIVVRDSEGTKIGGNYIGTDIDGTCPDLCDFGNGGSGIVIRRSSSNLIGEGDNTLPNIVAFNANGVVIESGERNEITINSIFSNGASGIDLIDGANASQPAPVIEQVKLFTTFDNQNNKIVDELLVEYRVDSPTATADTPHAVRFFIAGLSGTQGQTFIASDEYTGDPTVRFRRYKAEELSDDRDLLTGDDVSLVATTTDSDGNSSEFSIRVKVSAPLFLVNIGTDPQGDALANLNVDCSVQGANCTIRDALTKANQGFGGDTIEFVDGVRTISLSTELPELTKSVNILGNVDSDGIPVVALDGGNIARDGLIISADDSVIDSLVLENFTRNGIRILGSDNRIRNAIVRSNDGDGIRVQSGTGNTISQSAIFDNGGLGIEFGTAEANDSQRSPTIDEALLFHDGDGAGAVLRLKLEYSSEDTPPLDAEFFIADDTPDTTEMGGETFLTDDTYDNSGTKSLELSVSDDVKTELLNGDSHLVGTVTASNGNTSKFSPGTPVLIEVDASPAITSTVAGNAITYEIIVTNVGLTSASDVTLTDTLSTNSEFVSAKDLNEIDLIGTTCQAPAESPGGIVSCDIGSLGETGSGFESFTVVITANRLSDAQLVNSAEISIAQNQQVRDGADSTTDTISAKNVSPPGPGPSGGGGGGGGGRATTPPASNPPVIEITGSCCELSAVLGDTSSNEVALTFVNTGGESLFWEVEPTIDVPWLRLSARRGRLELNDEVTVLISAFGISEFPVGEQSVNLTISDREGNATSRLLAIDLFILQPAVISITPDEPVSLVASEGGEDQIVTVQIENAGQFPLAWLAEIDSDIEWLAIVGDAEGLLDEGASQSLEMFALISSEQLPVGTHTATLKVSGIGDSSSIETKTLSIVLDVRTRGIIEISPSDSLVINVIENTETSQSKGVQITNRGSQSLRWKLEIRSGDDWLSTEGKDEGTLDTGDSDTFDVFASTSGLESGTHRGRLALFDSRDDRVAEVELDITLIISSADSDGDGILNSIEPEDTNGDGTSDSEQAHVATLPDRVTGTTVSIVGPIASQLSEVVQVDADIQEGLTFPVGAYSFILDGIDRGADRIALSFLMDADFDSFFVQNSDGQWIPYDLTTVSIEPQTGLNMALLTISDGGDGDLDSVDGQIAFVGAPARNDRADVSIRGVLISTATGEPVLDSISVVNPMRYDFTLSNAGPADASGVTVSISIAPSVGLSIQNQFDAGTALCKGILIITCEIGDLPTGTTETFAFDLTASKSAPDTNASEVERGFSILSIVTSDTFDSNTSNDSSDLIEARVTAPSLDVAFPDGKPTLDIRIVEGNPNPEPLTLSITNSGDGLIRWGVVTSCDDQVSELVIPDWLSLVESLKSVRGSEFNDTGTIILNFDILGLIGTDESRIARFAVSAPNDTLDCTDVTVNLIVEKMSEAKPTETSANLSRNDLSLLKRIVQAAFDPQSQHSEQAASFVPTGSRNDVWSGRIAILAGAIVDDRSVRTQLATPSNADGLGSEAGLDLLASLRGSLLTWGPTQRPSESLSGESTALAHRTQTLSADSTLWISTSIDLASTSNEAALPEESVAWNDLGIVRVQGANGDTLHIAFDRERGLIFVHFDSFGAPISQRNLVPGQVDALIVVPESLEDLSVLEPDVLQRSAFRVRARILSPGEIRVVSESGNVAGSFDDHVVNTIPSTVVVAADSVLGLTDAHAEDLSVMLLVPTEADASELRYEVFGLEQGEYGLEIALQSADETEAERVFNHTIVAGERIITGPGQVDLFAVDWAEFSESAPQSGWSRDVDTNGDGVFDASYPVIVEELSLSDVIWPQGVIAAAVVLALVALVVFIIFRAYRGAGISWSGFRSIMSSFKKVGKLVGLGTIG